MMKLVIVEDEDIIREGLISYIDWNKLGYEVVGEAMNGKQGLEIVREKKSGCDPDGYPDACHGWPADASGASKRK